MNHFTTPKVFLVGYTQIDLDELRKYLAYSGNEEFYNYIIDAKDEGLSDGEILVSTFAKLCYRSLALGKNKNVSKVRDIHDNLIATINQGHLSVWEHINLNFIITDCSRVFTHELCRHRAGTAFAQTSGRYVRGDDVQIVFDPILEPIKEEIDNLIYNLELDYVSLCNRIGLNGIDGLQQEYSEREILEISKKLGLDEKFQYSFDKKKQLTSALRRILPNGQANEIAFSVNLRAVRHIIMLRTSRHAEWEIRAVFDQVYNILKGKFPLLFYGAKEENIEGLLEITGMRTQAYEK